jgi:hypothetical protein
MWMMTKISAVVWVDVYPYGCESTMWNEFPHYALRTLREEIPCIIYDPTLDISPLFP